MLLRADIGIISPRSRASQRRHALVEYGRVPVVGYPWSAPTRRQHAFSKWVQGVRCTISKYSPFLFVFAWKWIYMPGNLDARNETRYSYKNGVKFQESISLVLTLMEVLGFVLIQSSMLWPLLQILKFREDPSPSSPPPSKRLLLQFSLWICMNGALLI